MPEKIRIEADGAPPATGTYSHAIRHGNLVFDVIAGHPFE
jgi:hypothetical protein